MNYSKKGTIRNIIIAVIICVAALSLIVFLNDFDGTLAVLKTTDGLCMLYAVLLVLAYFALYPIPMVILMRYRKQKINFGRAYLIGASEHFFNAITPFATGGQPFQAYALSRAHVQVRESTGVLLMNYLIFMLVTNSYAIASLFYWNQFTSKVDNLVWIAIVGFVLNFSVLLLFFVMVFSKGFRNLMIRILKWLCQIKWINKLAGKKVDTIEDYFLGAQKAAQELLKNPLVFISCFLIKAVTMAIYYLVPFFVLKSLHVNIDASYIWYIMAGTSFATTVVVWMPTPGASGGIELAFNYIFMSIVGVTSSIAMSGMILWRAITFYMIAIISFVCYAITEIIARKVAKKELELGLDPNTCTPDATPISLVAEQKETNIELEEAINTEDK